MSEKTICTDITIALEKARHLKNKLDHSFAEVGLLSSPKNIKIARDIKKELLAEMERIEEILIEAYIEKHKFQEQYQEQIDILKQYGFIEDIEIKSDTGKTYKALGFMDINGKPCPLPTVSEISSKLLDKKDFITTKLDQGFTKILLVPFGMDLQKIVGKFEDFLLEYNRRHPHLDISRYSEVQTLLDIKNELKYDHPNSFKDTRWYTKQQILDMNTGSGWCPVLVQTTVDGKNIREAPDYNRTLTIGTKTPRPDIVTDKKDESFLKIRENDFTNSTSVYFGESMMNAETWIIKCMTQMMNFETSEEAETMLVFDTKFSSTTISFFPVRMVMEWKNYWDSEDNSYAAQRVSSRVENSSSYRQMSNITSVIKI